jgi:1-acyl-sn-glycerol-3-phosphate acyltransferase
MSSIADSVEAYVAQQPKFAWRRRILRGVIRTLGFKVLWKMTVFGLDNTPDDGPTLLIMNHISLIDPILVMGAVTKRFVIPPTKVENLRNPLLAPFIRFWGSFEIHRGEVDRKALMNSIELIKSGQLLLVAAEGTRHPEGLTQPKDGLAYIATKSNPIIVPVGISGAVLWKENLFRLRRTHITLNFGRPFRFKVEGRTRIPREELSMMTTEAMYQIASTITDESLRGEFSDLRKMTTDYIEFV